MKIAVIVSTFPKLSETFILNQITGLLKRGHTVRIFSRFHPEEKVFHPEVTEYRLLKRTVYLPAVPTSKWACRLKAVGWLLRFLFTHPAVLFRVLRFLLCRKEPFSYLLFFHSLPILSFHPDVIHVHYGHNGNQFLPLKQIVPTSAFLTMFHGHDIHLGKEGGPGYYKELFRIADLILTNSEHTRCALLNQGAVPQKTMVHPVGICLKRFRFCGRTPRSSETPARILTISRLHEDKGVDCAIRAVAHLKTLLPDLPLEYRIVGDGPLEKPLKQLAEQTGLHEQIIFLGALNQSGVVEQLRQADLFLLMSVHEGLGVVLLEAQAMEVPIVATNVDGIPEAVLPGRSAILVPAGDAEAAARAMAELLKDPQRRIQMGREGRKYVEERYDVDVLNDKLIRIYSEILQNCRRQER
ncbi:MAG: glycosyltransferase [Anaerohalosphaeraceae bacterium]